MLPYTAWVLMTFMWFYTNRFVSEKFALYCTGTDDILMIRNGKSQYANEFLAGFQK